MIVNSDPRPWPDLSRQNHRLTVWPENGAARPVGRFRRAFLSPMAEAHPIYRMPVLLSGGDTDLILLFTSGDNHEVIVRERMTGIAL
jgi:hypothetical protein